MKEYLNEIERALKEKHFIKVTLSKPFDKKSELKNVYVRQVQIQNKTQLYFTFRYVNRDETKNFLISNGLHEIEILIEKSFKNATLFSAENDFALLTTKKGKKAILKSSPSSTLDGPNTHDRPKLKRADGKSPYLRLLGIADKNGNIIPKMADKYRQINKYLEIIDSLIGQVRLPNDLQVVDMGSGKGYLTFALYDHLMNEGYQPKLVGVEMRKELVEYCNDVAGKCGFDGLSFIQKSIAEFEEEKIDILIALHACDTATDDAISKGIGSQAQMIVCAPCCHKQIRQQLKGKEQSSPLLKYGIFKERQFEMVTDTIRALILEKNQYQSKVFEFVSNEHTRKNVMLVGVKKDGKSSVDVEEKIEALKQEYQIEQHYLETLI
ncbi:MAG: SAM-dependent methyltransferase [Cyclobacteriaceae bacterium]